MHDKQEFAGRNMTSGMRQFKAVMLPIGVALSLSIFVGTLYAGYSSNQAHNRISYPIIVIGTSLFLSLMTWINYLAINGTVLQQVVKAAGIALVEATLFVVLLWFLILNTALSS